MHVLIVYDSANATASDRCRFYVNLSRITAFDVETYPSASQALLFWPTTGDRIIGAGNSNYGDFDLAEFHSLDGVTSVVDSSDFATTDPDTGRVVPIEYTGSYGTDGFYLDFSDNSAATSAAIGADRSGNGNDWTPNNISVTAGVNNDSFVDTPTPYGGDAGNGGEVRGNYCTWNPLWPSTSGLSAVNLAVTNGTARGNHALLYYDAYWEITASGGSVTAGVIDDAGTANTTTIASGKTYGFRLTAAGALDYKNITDAGSWTSITTGLGGTQFPYATCGSGVTAWLNAGQRPFAATAPSGFKCLCLQNLTDTTVSLPASFTGNASADGPFLWANGEITAITINGNVATRGTDFDTLANGLKIRSSSASFNAAGSNTINSYTASTAFKNARAQAN